MLSHITIYKVMRVFVLSSCRYVGMDETHKASFRGYLKERLFDLITPSCKEVRGA
jgi:hypothetical protein